jgi:arsenite methyltransferase
MAELTNPEPASSCCAPDSCGCAARQAEPDIREVVREKYAAAARAAGDAGSWCCEAGFDANDVGTQVFGETLYGEEGARAPEQAVKASLGCGVPTAVADLHECETVLDPGSGAGADVLISAKRVGPSGKAIGLDMTDEMLDLARANAAEAGVENVEFVKGYIEDIPLPDASVDVVISNCVINLAGEGPGSIPSSSTSVVRAAR